MIPTLLHIGPLPLNSFGLLMVLAFFSAWRMFAITLEQVGEDPATAENVIFWAALCGLLGARVGYILSFPAQFLNDPLSLIFSGAGFVFYGGFIGGACAFFWLLRGKNRTLLSYCDLVSPALAIGYAVGRIGCQLSGDGDYGSPTTLPWGVSYEHGYVPTPLGVFVHPTPVYETIVALVIALLLANLGSRRSWYVYSGAITGLYLLLSSCARFFVEFLRIEPRIFYALTQAQLVSLFLGLVGVVLLSRNLNNKHIS